MSKTAASLVLAGAMLLGGAADGAVARPLLHPENLILRLPDVGPGYQVGDDTGCNMGLVDEGSPKSLARLQSRHQQRNCGIDFEQLWTPPDLPRGAPLVGSHAFVFRRSAGAAAGFEVARDLVAYTLGLPRRSLKRSEPPAPIGDVSALFRTTNALVEGLPRRPGTAIVWRAGRVLSIAFAAEHKRANPDDAAVRAAGLQQARIAAPTQLAPFENDDREVPLDNPDLGVEVHWLGRRFRPGGDLPSLRLLDAYGPLGRGGGPGYRAELEYVGGGSVRLGLWKPSTWRGFRRTKLGRLVWHEPCVGVRRFSVQGGRAVIYSGHSTRQTRCGRRRPDRLLGHVRLENVVVSVNIPTCFGCRASEGGRYHSVTGLRAVMKGLRLRQAQGTSRPSQPV